MTWSNELHAPPLPRVVHGASQARCALTPSVFSAHFAQRDARWPAAVGRGHLAHSRRLSAIWFAVYDSEGESPNRPAGPDSMCTPSPTRPSRASASKGRFRNRTTPRYFPVPTRALFFSIVHRKVSLSRLSTSPNRVRREHPPQSSAGSCRNSACKIQASAQARQRAARGACALPRYESALLTSRWRETRNTEPMALRLLGAWCALPATPDNKAH